MECENKDNFQLIIYSKLPIIEVILYYIVWISGMLYLLYNVYLTSIGMFQDCLNSKTIC